MARACDDAMHLPGTDGTLGHRSVVAALRMSIAEPHHGRRLRLGLRECLSLLLPKKHTFLSPKTNADSNQYFTCAQPRKREDVTFRGSPDGRPFSR